LVCSTRCNNFLGDGIENLPERRGKLARLVMPGLGASETAASQEECGGV